MTMTAEDGFRQDNVQWIASLRPLLPLHHVAKRTASTEQLKTTNKKEVTSIEGARDGGDELDEDEAAAREQARLESMEPPSFYEADQRKW